MSNVLFSLETGAMSWDDFAVAGFVGILGFRATTERQMRQEFVRDYLLHTETVVAAQHDHTIEQPR